MKKIKSYLVCIFLLVSGNTIAQVSDVVSFPEIILPTESSTLDSSLFIPIPSFSPDLVVTELSVTGDTILRADGFSETPVRAVIKNQALITASTFMISAGYITSRGDFMVAFTVPGQNSIWKPRTMASLFPNETVAIEGVLTGHPSTSGETVEFYVIADSCAAEEFMPEYCRIQESDETNNTSDTVSVSLP